MRPPFSRLMIPVVLVLFGQLGLAQQTIELTGIIESQDQLVERTRVSIHIVDRDGVWGNEIATVTPVAGTFSISAGPVGSEELRPFRSGAVLLPGLQNEYRVSPDDVNYVQGRVNMYVDQNESGTFERVSDAFYIGVSSLEEPVGFFSLLYVDRDTTLTGAGVTLELRQGWNVFTVRFPSDSGPIYGVHRLVDDLVLTAVLP